MFSLCTIFTACVVDAIVEIVLDSLVVRINSLLVPVFVSVVVLNIPATVIIVKARIPFSQCRSSADSITFGIFCITLTELTWVVRYVRVYVKKTQEFTWAFAFQPSPINPAM